MAKRWIFAFCLMWVLCSGLPVRGQNQVLVVEGGTLIDGTGAEPLRNAVVVIEGNRIKAVGTKGKISYPPNAQVIKVPGKHILPGLIDAEAQGFWEWQPPLWLHFGITTVYYAGSPYIKAQKELQEKGTLKSPRIFLHMGIEPPIELDRPDRREGAVAWPKGWSVHTPEEARAAVRKRIAEGAENIMSSEGFPPEILSALTDEAHKHGVGVGGHSSFADVSALAGQDYTTHFNSIVRAVIKDPANIAKMPDKEKQWALYYPSPTANYEYLMEPAQFDSLIQKMVSNNMALNPTIAHHWWTWGVQIPTAKQFAHEVIQFAKSNQASLAFVPQNVRNIWLKAEDTVARGVTGRWVVGDQVDASHPTDLEGYNKRDEFLRRFVQAGGKLLGGADNSRDFVPGLCTHQELQQLVYSGVPPMQAIMAVTKWSAEIWRKQKDLGTVEVGKLADLIVVAGDPLTNIANLRNVDVVIQDGKVVDTTLDPNWKNPMPQPRGGGGG